MAVDVEVRMDAGAALDLAGEFLTARSVDHNLLLTILHERVADPEPGRYWIAREGGEVVGFALQSPLTFSAAVSPSPPHAVHALVDTMSGDVPDLPGVIGEASTTASFAGAWTECRGVPAAPVEGQRIYRLAHLVIPEGIPGRLRRAEPHDRARLVSWAEGFQAETHLSPASPDDAVDRHLDGGRLFVWDHEGPVSMAAATTPVAGVSRIGLVYTPPGARRRGYATACVAALSRRVLDADAEACILYTQLHNATSNGIYRAIGFEAVAEVLSYRFGGA